MVIPFLTCKYFSNISQQNRRNCTKEPFNNVFPINITKVDIITPVNNLKLFPEIKKKTNVFFKSDTFGDCVCVYMFTHVHMCAHMYRCTWSPKIALDAS